MQTIKHPCPYCKGSIGGPGDELCTGLKPVKLDTIPDNAFAVCYSCALTTRRRNGKWVQLEQQDWDYLRERPNLVHNLGMIQDLVIAHNKGLKSKLDAMASHPENTTKH